MIRRLRANEAEALRAIRLQALERDPQAYCSTLARESAYPLEFWEARAQSTAVGSEQAIFVAESGERLVGMTGARRLDETGSPVEIWGVYLEAELRGQGLGRAMLEMALQWAGEATVTLEVNESLKRAMHLYLAAGFQSDGARSELADGRWVQTWTRPAS